jgi:hypothetical protein
MGDTTMSDIIVNIHAKYDPVTLLDPFGDFDTKIFQKQFSGVEGLGQYIIISGRGRVQGCGSAAAALVHLPLLK